MQKPLHIAARVVPVITSLVLVRWIVINGSDLRIWINDNLKDSFGVLLDNWDLDHAVFGFCIGLPLSLITLLLISLKKFHVLKLLLVMLIFHVLQACFLLVLAYNFATHITTEISEYHFIFIPDIWFWNSALLTASVLSLLLICAMLIIFSIRSKKSESNTLDQ